MWWLIVLIVTQKISILDGHMADGQIIMFIPYIKFKKSKITVTYITCYIICIVIIIFLT